MLLRADNSSPVVLSSIEDIVLDYKNNCQQIKPYVKQLQALGIPLIFCSNMTKGEIELYRKELCITDPFIAENGGAIFVPKEYFSFNLPGAVQTGEFSKIELGDSYDVVRGKLLKVAASIDARILGFGDMSAEELSEETGLPLAIAKLAKKRQHDEPFRLLDGSLKDLARGAQSEGLILTVGGKYFHVLGGSDKAKAVGVLKKLLANEFGSIITYGIGDKNDKPMLAAVNKPSVVRRGFRGKEAQVSGLD